jgi:hypothetical protein
MMVLSFATYGRALGLLNHPDLTEAKWLILKPAAFEQIDQDPLWKALYGGYGVRLVALALLPVRRRPRYHQDALADLRGQDLQPPGLCDTLFLPPLWAIVLLLTALLLTYVIIRETWEGTG